MQTEAFQADAAGRCKGSTSRARLNPDDFLRIAIRLPPLAEQRKIAAILSSVDEAIQATQAVIDQTRRVKEGLLQDLLTRGLPGHHTRFKQTEIGEIPESWECTKLANMLSHPIRNGYSPVCSDRPNGRWILGLGALSPEGLKADAVKPAPLDDPRVEEFMLRPGDFLVSRSNTPERVGLSALFRGEVPRCAYPDLMMRFRVQEQRVHPPFLEYFLRSSATLTHLRGAAAGTSASMVKITGTTLEALPVPLPPMAEQERIATRVQVVEAATASGAEQRARLMAMKTGLHQDLLTGKVRVTP
jgi:type I restriction enzyme S subunit